jgi:hypothetical protein
VIGAIIGEYDNLLKAGGIDRPGRSRCRASQAGNFEIVTECLIRMIPQATRGSAGRRARAKYFHARDDNRQ